MRTDGVVNLFPLAQFAIEPFHLQRAGSDLVELLGVSAVGALDGTIELGGSRRQDEQVQAALLAGLLELGGELTAAIACTARMGKGMRCCKVSRNWAAVAAVARVWAWIASQREITSRAVNCLKITPGRGRISRVSTCTRSPG